MQTPYQSAQLGHSLELHELHYQLTLIQHYRPFGDADPGNTNQVEVIASPGGGLYEFGNMVANDWDLVDPSQNDKIVAHARGLHIQACRGEQCWHTSFDIVFEEGSGLEGSTLQVMGPHIIDGEWSIVGGTGQLSMARGIIYKTTRKEYDNGGEAQADLEIHAFYIPMERRPNRYGTSTDGKNVWSW